MVKKKERKIERGTGGGVGGVQPLLGGVGFF
jgi:hypothetical protein